MKSDRSPGDDAIPTLTDVVEFDSPTLTPEELAAVQSEITTRVLELALDDHLRGDARVVGSGLPQGVVTFHAMKACQRIHQRVLERVPHVQRPGHVGRRDHDRVGRAAAGWREVAGTLPLSVAALLDIVRRVSLVHQ